MSQDLGLCKKGQFYKTDNLIGEGVSSKVYQAKNKNQKLANIAGSYVVKEFNMPIKDWMLIEQRASELKIAPETILIPCEEIGKLYLIQKKVDGTLNQLVENHPSILQNKKVKLQLRNLLIKSIQKLNVLHNDLHGDNILYKVKTNGSLKFYLIDFENFLPIERVRTLSPRQKNIIKNSHRIIIKKTTGETYFKYKLQQLDAIIE